MNVILSGGGTAGHINPAIAVANELDRQSGNEVNILFVGALGKMEMERVPKAGYRIVGVPIAGLQRRLTPKNILHNLALPFKLWRSERIALRAIRSFGADVVVGFGGYASAPVLRVAQRLGIPTILQEQNSYAGLANKRLAKKARYICVAYEGMERFFPQEKIGLTGNPLRGGFAEVPPRDKALAYFGLSNEKPVILVVGGSLGSRTLNEAVMNAIDDETLGKVQIIWQTGRYYDEEMSRRTVGKDMTGIWRGEFIDRMDLAFAASDVVISRAGATTISELCLAGKAVVFVPSPNVAEDHQRKNAQALVNRDAAIMVLDSEAARKAVPVAVDLAQNVERIAELKHNILQMATPNAAKDIAEVIMSLY